jgi:hypothetical protein
MSWELPSLSSSFAFKEKNQDPMMSWKACRRLLHLRKKLRNDDKLPSLLSSTTLEKKRKKMSQGGSPSFATLEKKKQRNDDEPFGSPSFVLCPFTN